VTFNAGRPEGGPTRRVIQTQSITETSSPVFRAYGVPEVLSLAKVSGKAYQRCARLLKTGTTPAGYIQAAG
jgi:hypothetical protein